MDNTTSVFPFELAIKEEDQKVVFIKTVEQIMEENLQSKRTFGCHIKNCHMHIGSKIHTNEFIEAELLFHNSYYNSHFAWLTKKYIEEEIRKTETEVDSIILVGYEIFGEMYLLECVRMLKNTFTCPVHYCVAEAKGGRVKIRSTIPNDAINPDGHPYYVFIVPISTTLTTHDKLMNAYQLYLLKTFTGNQEDTAKNTYSIFDEKNSTNLALIVIGPNKNDYWEEVPLDTTVSSDPKSIGFRYLQLKEEKRESLNLLKSRKVGFFARHEMDWYFPKMCPFCYPDRNGKGNSGKKHELTEETPIFEVSKEAIVPVLQIGIDSNDIPLNSDSYEGDTRYQYADINIRKVIDLSHYMYAKHVIRNGNHYQYYIDSQDYIEHLLKEPCNQYFNEWEKELRNKLIFEDKSRKSSSIVYDFIVAPRHFSNAGFVHEVSTNVFNESARVLYIDVNKEYRKNLVAKYSDFSAQVKKIAGNKQKYKIRFHYVDDMIISGSSYYRSKSLINSLLSGLDINSRKIELFSSVIVLVDRNSEDSRKNYISDIKNYYSYVYLKISSLRNQENSCVLCNVRKSFKILRREAALNETSSEFKKCFDKYDTVDCQELENERYADPNERLLMIVGHILEERLDNRWFYGKAPGANKKKESLEDRKIGAVNAENENHVLKVLDLYYKNLPMYINMYVEKESVDYLETGFDTQDVEIAMIKIISRPFFTNHIRRRQAAFKFCINKTAEYLKLPKDKMNSRIRHIKQLINALSDLNANYLFRRENIKRFLDIELLQSHYIRAVKKEISLSNDENKSVLLEHALVKGSENWFFEGSGISSGDDTTINHKEAWMALYFENNSVLKSSMIKAGELKTKENKYPYYLSSFIEIMKVNGIENDRFPLLNDYVKAFFNLYAEIRVNNERMNGIQYVAECMMDLLCCDPDQIDSPMYIFIKDRKQEAKGISSWDRYAILAMNRKDSKIDFYSSTNLKELDMLTAKNVDKETVTSVMDTIYYFKHNTNELNTDHKSLGKITVINLYEENDVGLYLKLEESIDEFVSWQEDKKNDGDSVSSQETPKKKGLQHLLPLKILLSIRYEIAKYMSKNNVLSYLQGIKSKDIKNALLIRKASKHQDLGINEGNIPHQIMYSIYSASRELKTDSLNGIIDYARRDFYITDAVFPDSFIDSYGTIANKYIQYLANEYISSFYKEMVTLSIIDEEKKDDIKLGLTSLDRVLDYFKKMGFEEQMDGTELNMEMYVPNHHTRNSHRLKGEQRIKITIHKEGFSKQRIFWTRKAGTGALTAYYYLLVISLSMNAGKHFRRSEDPNCTCYVDVSIENEYLVIRNSIADTMIGEDELYKIKTQATQRMNTPPWFFKEKEQSITLWTLNTFMELFKKNARIINKSYFEEGENKKWILVRPYNDESGGKAYFEVKLRLISDRYCKRKEQL